MRGSRESRYINDINHQISKALVEQYPKGTLFVLEDLTGIRVATEKVRLRDRYIHASWAFFDLREKIEYKANLWGSKVIFVDPAYTSQTCPKCGTIDRNSRDKKKHIYTCRHCGYSSNDDRVGAMNLHQKGIKYQKNAAAEEQALLQGALSISPECDATVLVLPDGTKVGEDILVCTTGQSQAPSTSEQL